MVLNETRRGARRERGKESIRHMRNSDGTQGRLRRD